MASKIVPYIPRHTVYCEPFAGAGTVLFAKQTPKVTCTGHYREYLNDKNGLVMNFYEQLRDNGEELQRRLGLTPHHEGEHNRAKEICKKPETAKDKIELARAFFVNVNWSFSNQISDSFTYGSKGSNKSHKYNNKREALHQYVERLKHVCFFHREALKVIKALDSPQTFFYLDPPYPKANQGHYKGYTLEDYQALIDTLKDCKGSFILSNYAQGIEPKEWRRVDIEARMSAANHKTASNSTNYTRIESLWVVDRGGGIEQDYFRKIYERPEFVEIWGHPREQLLWEKSG